MKVKSYHILYRLFAFLADKTNGFSFFVKYKLVLGTLILGVSATSCAKKQPAQGNIDDENMQDTIDYIKNYISCYRIVPLLDSVNEAEEIPFAPPVIGSEEGLIDIPPILCYDIALPVEGEVDSCMVINEPTYCYVPIPVPEMIPEKADVEFTPPKIIIDDDPIIYDSCYMTTVVPIDSTVVETPPEPKVYFYGAVEQPPVFQGGTLSDFVNWIRANIDQSIVDQSLKEGVEGKLVVSFVVNEKGEVVDITTLRSVSPTIDDEVIRTMKKSPLWSAGKHLGEDVSTKITVSLRFPDKDSTLNQIDER